MEPLLSTATESAALGVRALPIPLDITDAAARANLLPAIRAQCGGLDILVHNAGILAGGPLAKQSGVAIGQVMQTNLTAAIDLTRLAQDDLIQRRGALVFVGSALAFVPMPNATLYAASKAGLHGFAQAIRYELEPAKVRVMAAYPPGTDTAMVANRRIPSLPAYRLEDPDRAGERIVAALVAGRRTVVWGGERWLIGLHKLAPRLVERALSVTRGWFVW
jgi:short-subunit dehydrogenase